MRYEAFLSQKAEPATPEDLPVAQDLLDTLEFSQLNSSTFDKDFIDASLPQLLSYKSAHH